jgi:hypothetical protein
VGKPQGKTPLGKPRRRREDGIKMDDLGLLWMRWWTFGFWRHGVG